MSRDAATRPLRWAVPLALSLAALALLLGLGFWQLDRKAWKEGLIAELNRKLAAPVAALPGPDQWPALTPDQDEFRRVRFSAAFLPGRDALVYTNGSPLRPDIKGVGYWVFTPARLADGRTLVVNRGFVLEGRHDSASLSAGLTGAPVDMVGALRWPEPRGLFTPADDAAHGTFFVRDIQAMAAARGWGPVPEVYIDLEAPAPAAGPRPGPLAVALPNRHLEYAVTWFGLAAVLVLVLIFRVAGGRGQRNAAPP